MTKTLNPDIANIGMVTGAVWTDIDGDGQKDLVIIGEWMTPRIFSFKKDHFEELKTNLGDLYGWWETVSAADINGDGKPDLILGNIGENFYLRPDSTNPVKLWINDFDQNGTPDIIMTRTDNGRDVPVFLKHEMEEEIPSIKKLNLRNEDYAKKSIQDLFPSNKLQKAQVKEFNYCSSVVAINKGNGQFAIQKLPFMVQLSSVNAVQCTDVDGDGHPDIVAGGNEFGLLPQFGRLDAGFGNILLGNGKGGFTWQPENRTGLELNGQIRDIAVIPGKNDKFILFLQNDEVPVLYKINPKK
jgi:hypothetical protein